MGRLNLSFQYDCTYVISASHTMCEALIRQTLKDIAVQPKGSGNKGYTKRSYVDIIGCFDIETTRIETYKGLKFEQSVMYVWQYQLGGKLTIIGRTWEEFTKTMQLISDLLPEETWLCNFIHNASYEFQFISGIYPFKDTEVFCIKPRKVLKFDMYDNLEFRCSMLHSNMGLGLYTKKMKVDHLKQDGKDYDYNKKRYSWTPLDKKELKYQIHDVLGLWEALTKEMYMDGDNIASFPLTSTGYVRRDVKKAVRENVPYTFIQNQLPPLNLIKELEDGFRGGDTHANRHTSNKILKNVRSVDRSSSYPDVQINCKFPVSKFIKVKRGEESLQKVEELIGRERAVIFRVKLFDVKMRDDTFPDPYISVDKCKIRDKDKHLTLINPTVDNGRVLAADYLETTITDIDWRIIKEVYSFREDLSEAYDIWSARYGYLPDAYRDVIKYYYELKTKLKGDESQEVFYEKLKNKLNAVYGMSAQHVLRTLYYFDTHDKEKPYKIKESDELDQLNKAYRGAFSSYAWGCWTTCWARFRLYEGMKIIHRTKGAVLVYWDTDSLKYCGIVDFTEYNKQRVFDSSVNGAVGIDSKGDKHFMGVLEEETDKFAVRFKTMGAKKYAYETLENGVIKLHTTIAGVNKKLGALELEENGGLDAMVEGFKFVKAGGTKLTYNDLETPIEIKIQGHDVKVTSNVVISDDEYTLSMTGDYKRILSNFEDEYLDMDFDMIS